MSDRSDLADRLADVLAPYALAPGDVEVQPLSFVSNAVCRVDVVRGSRAGARLVLRMSPVQTLEVSSWELLWLRALADEASLLTPCPVPSTDNDLIVRRIVPGLGAVDCVMFEWIDATFLQTSDQTTGHANTLGRFIADLHAHSSTFRPTPTPRPLPVDDGWIEQDRAGLLSHTDRIELAGAYEDGVAAVQQLDDDVGLIHADLIAKNYFFHEGIAGALDFADCCEAPYAYDLAVVLTGYRDEPAYKDLRAALLAGYNDRRKLPRGADDVLDQLMVLRHAVSVAWVLDHLDRSGIAKRARAIIDYRLGEIRALR